MRVYPFIRNEKFKKKKKESLVHSIKSHLWLVDTHLWPTTTKFAVCISRKFLPPLIAIADTHTNGTHFCSSTRFLFCFVSLKNFLRVFVCECISVVCLWFSFFFLSLSQWKHLLRLLQQKIKYSFRYGVLWCSTLKCLFAYSHWNI